MEQLENDQLLDARIDALSTRLQQLQRQTADKAALQASYDETLRQLMEVWALRANRSPSGKKMLPVVSLDDVKLATPCKVSWQEMQGDGRIRHCSQCDKKVYNLSGMPKATAEKFLALYADSCVRFYQRHDGTVLSGDCPTGRRIARLERLAKGSGLLALGALVLMTAWRAVTPTRVHGGVNQGTAQVTGLSAEANR